MPDSHVPTRILLLEDDYWDTAAYRERLQEIGVMVRHVQIVEEAIVAIQGRKHFDGIVMEVVVKGTSGLELIRWINDHYTDHPPILVHSHETFLEEIDLEVLNFHASERVTFARKARLMRGDVDRDYSYLVKFVQSLTTG